jgi:hypothetical protein
MAAFVGCAGVWDTQFRVESVSGVVVDIEDVVVGVVSDMREDAHGPA